MRSLAVFLVALFLICSAPAHGEDLVVRKAKKQISLTGYTRSAAAVTVSSEVSGKLLKVNYEVGDTVGDAPFFALDDTFVDFQIASTRQSIRKIEAAVRKNESHVAYLAREFDRIDKLHKGDRATGVKRDAALEELTQARLERDVLAADRAALEAALAELKERKRRHRIDAPAGWIVVDRTAEAGEIIVPNVPLARVADFRSLVVPLAVSGEELRAIRDLPAPFGAELEGTAVRARLNWVNPEFDEATRKLAVELVVDGYDGDHRGGLRFAMPLTIDTQGLWVPRSAVVNRYENPRVVLRESGETVGVLVLGESNDHLIVAEDPKLPVGTPLAAP